MALTERQFDLCALYKVNFPDQRCSVIDLTQNPFGKNADGKVRNGRAEIITPGGVKLVTDQARCLTGYECMLLQGIHYGRDQLRVEDFESSLLKDLAGNAFQSHCMAAALIVKKTVEARLAVLRAMVQRVSQDPERPLKRPRTLDELCVWED